MSVEATLATVVAGTNWNGTETFESCTEGPVTELPDTTRERYEFAIPSRNDFVDSGVVCVMAGRDWSTRNMISSTRPEGSAYADVR
jgi:hypothetical protein